MNCKTPILDEPFGQPSLLASVPPQTTPQLQALIAAEVARQTKTLVDEIAALEARLAALEAASAPPVDAAPGEAHSPQQVPAPPDTAILEEIIQLRVDMDAMNDLRALEIAQDRQRLGALEMPKPNLSQTTAADHLDRLFSEMRRLGIGQATIKDAARILGMSVPQMKNVKPHLSNDFRFVIVKDTRHKQRHLIRLI